MILFLQLIRNRTLRLQEGMLLLVTSANALMLWSSNRFLHYYIIYVPVLLLIFVLYAKLLLSHIPELLTALLVLAFFVSEDIPLLSGLPEAKNAPDRFAYAAAIPEEEKDPAMVLYASPEAYLNSGLIPCSRYAAYHFAHFPVVPSMKEEFLNDMRTNQPTWIVFLSGYEGVIPEVRQILDKNYETMHEEYDIAYYRIRGQQNGGPAE